MTLDPHTAIGVKAAEELHDETLDATICLATAHPSKFLSAVHKAIASVDSGESETNNAGDCSLDADIERRILEQAAHGKAPFDIPQPFIGILDRQKRCLRSGPEPAAIKQLIIETLAGCHGE